MYVLYKKVQEQERPPIILENDIDFYRKMAFQNLNRMYLLSKIFLWVNIFLGLLNLGYYFLINRDASYHQIYLLPYSLLFLTYCFGLIYAHPNHIKVNASIQYYKHFEKVVVIFLNWVLMLSLWISLLDQLFYQHTIIYSITGVICASFFIMRIRYLIFQFALAILAFGLNYFHLFKNYDHYFFSMQLVIMLIPILIIVAYKNYGVFVESYRHQKYLCYETRRANQLANDLEKANTELKQLSCTDELTKISNRRGLHQYVTDLKKRHFPIYLTVLMLDIDYFKNYNDYYGHAYGDLVLSNVATVLNNVALSTNCFTARWGGEEFIFLAVDKNPEEIITIYRLITKEINHYDLVNAASTIANNITFSIGAYRGRIGSLDDVRHFTKKADSLLYEVKQSGRNGFLFMEEENILYKFLPNESTLKTDGDTTK